MSDEPLSPEEQKELNELAVLVAESLASGEKPAAVAQQLVDNGWERQDADEFVTSVSAQLVRAQNAQPSGGGGGMGWLIWIGALLFINFLSWVFDWPFWVY